MSEQFDHEIEDIVGRGDSTGAVDGDSDFDHAALREAEHQAPKIAGAMAVGI